tara:strand:+ start:704 stop:5779 length:5076 start_codon:yes stop_codon:yes gene_type:complete
MPDYTVKELKERTELEKSLTAEVDRRLVKIREMHDFNNRTASSINEQYSALRMQAEEEEARFSTQQEHYELITQSLQDQEAAIDALQNKATMLTEAEAAKLESLEKTVELRKRDAQAYEDSVRNARQQLATQKKIKDEAREQQKLNEETARDMGKNIANAMGFHKKQKSITKEFMKSKNKALFLKNAVKGLASQISLVQIGSKMMTSGFQMAAVMFTKAFGMQGGGGGKNLSEFVKMTGHAKGQLYGLAKEAARMAKRLKVGFEEGGKAVADLMKNMSGFMDMSKRQQKILAKATVEMMAFGVSAETSAQMYELFSRQLGVTGKKAVKMQKQMWAEAQALGINIAEYQEGILKFNEAVPGLGKNLVKVYREASAAAKALGFETAEALAKATDGFDTYESAAKKAAGMNQVFGKQVFDSNKLLLASESGNPADIAKELNMQMAKAGVEYKNMTHLQKKALAKGADMDVTELDKLLQGKEGLTKIEKAQGKINRVTGAVKKFNQAIKKTKPPGGGGQKDFLSLVLKEYNKLTGGRFFIKLRGGRRKLKHLIRDLAKWVAELIQKMEKLFHKYANKAMDWIEGAVTDIGEFFGMKDLGEGMFDSWRDGLEHVKDMFPLLLPFFPMIAGALVSAGGILLKMVGVLPGLIKGMGSLAAGAAKFAGNMLRTGLYGAAGLGKGGGLKTQAKNLFGMAIGDTSLRSMESLQRSAQPVMVVNQDPIRVVTVGGDGSDVGNIASAAAQVLGGRGVKLRGLGLSKTGMAVAQSQAATASRGGTLGRLWQAGKGGWKQGKHTGIGRLRGSFGAMKTSWGRMRKTAKLAKTPAIAKELKNANKLLAMRQGGTATSLMKGLGDPAAKIAAEATKTGMGGKAMQLGGKLMGGAARVLGPVGALYGAYSGLTKIADGEVMDGMTDLAAGALMFAGPLGMLGGGAIMLYKHFNQLGDGTVGYKDSLANLDDSGKKLMAAQDKQRAAALKLAKNNEAEVQKLHAGSTAGGTGVFTRGKMRAASLVAQDNRGLASGSGVLDKNYGYGIQSDSMLMSSVHKDLWANVNADHGDAIHTANKTHDIIDKRREELKGLGYELDEQAKKRIAGRIQAAREVFNKQRLSYIEGVKKTEAFKDAYGTYSAKELANQDAMIVAANKRLDVQWELEKKTAELIAIQEETNKIIQGSGIDATKMKSNASKFWTLREQAEIEYLQALKGEGKGAAKAFAAAGGTERLNELIQKQTGAGSVAVLSGALAEVHGGKGGAGAAASVFANYGSGTRSAGKAKAFKEIVGKLNESEEGMKALMAVMNDNDVYNMFTGDDGDRLQQAIMRSKGGDTEMWQLDTAQLNHLATDFRQQSSSWGTESWNSFMESLFSEEAGLPEEQAKELADYYTKLRHENFIEDMGNFAEKGAEQQKNLYQQAIDSAGKTDGMLTGYWVKMKEDMGFTTDETMKLRKTWVETVQQAMQGKGEYAGMSPIDIMNDLVMKERARIEETQAVMSRAEGLAQKGFKVTKKDINLLEQYMTVIEEFSKILVHTDIATLFQPFQEQIDLLITRTASTSAATSSEFMKNAGILFFNSRKLTSSTGKNVERLGASMKKLVGEVDAGEFQQVADGLRIIANQTVAPTSKSAVDMIAKANEEFPKLKKHVEGLQETTAGALFFKGGTINHKVDSTTKVELHIDGKQFGKAALKGMKSAGIVSVGDDALD